MGIIVSSPLVARLVLDASFGGSDTAAIVRALRDAGWVPPGDPESIAIDFEKRDGQLSLDDALTRGGYVQAWFEGLPRMFVTTGRRVEVDFVEIDAVIPSVLETLAAMPFEIAAFGSIHDWEGYRRPGWGDGHHKLGWGAAFRGRGHDRLVSRHWLEGGPFTVWRGAGDTSLVQFHALDADEQTALEQAKPGHREIGITDSTGFIQTDFVFKLERSGLYEETTRTMKVVVLGREIPDREFLEWAAARASKRVDPPLERVAYVFPDEAEGRRALPRLYRYGHECWVIRDGIELRLDDTYVPPDTTPAWAR